MSIRDADVTEIRGRALLASDGDTGLDHVTLTGRSVLLGSLLAGHGLHRGDVVALLAPLAAAAYEVLVGTRRAGLVLLVVDPTQTVEQNAFAINTSGAVALLAASSEAATAEALVPLTPYIATRYGLDAEFAGHRSLPLARSAAPFRAIDGEPGGVLHHLTGPSGRPRQVPMPDPLSTAVGVAYCEELVGDLRVGPHTVLVESAPVLTPTAAHLGVLVLASGGSVAVPRRPSGVEALRTAFSSDATILHLTSRVAAEIAGLGVDRVRRLTPPGLDLVVVDGPGCAPEVRSAVRDLWGPAVRVVDPSYLEVPEPESGAEPCSDTHAEI